MHPESWQLAWSQGQKIYSFLAFCQSRSSLEDDNLAIGGSTLRTNAEIMNNFYFILVIEI
jgi:hypothetical protein